MKQNMINQQYLNSVNMATHGAVASVRINGVSVFKRAMLAAGEHARFKGQDGNGRQLEKIWADFFKLNSCVVKNK